MRFFGLIGKSLEHSFSPVFFKEKFEREGIKDCFYNLYPLKTIDEFNQLISDFSELSGLNVTIPYKQEIIPFLQEIETEAAEIGAVNTIRFDWANNQLKLIGYNTDYLGFINSLQPLLSVQHKSAIVLGTGGSSLAITHALTKLGIEFIQVSRKQVAKNIISYHDLSEEMVTKNKIIINTTPVGMYPDQSKCPDIPYQAITKQHLLYDLIYNPKQTEFLCKGLIQGALIKNGFEMLIKQAEFSWKIWNKIHF
ncbi:MAG: shikimate dehydrogenase [Marinilabiliales bacterium]|nr:MAG: shikimate dehydrogenase [Marinilabiliales bacterium]